MLTRRSRTNTIPTHYLLCGIAVSVAALSLLVSLAFLMISPLLIAMALNERSFHQLDKKWKEDDRRWEASGGLRHGGPNS